jgi:hypothetical protein
MKAVKAKKRGSGLEFRTFKGRSGQSYTVLKTLDGSYHVLVETESKAAARDCGAAGDKNTRQLWQSVWES